jgi:hypothetical protein
MIARKLQVLTASWTRIIAGPGAEILSFHINLVSRSIWPHADDWMHVTPAAQNRLDDARKGTRREIWSGSGSVPRCWSPLTAIARHCCTMISKACQAGLLCRDPTLHQSTKSTAGWCNKSSRVGSSSSWDGQCAQIAKDQLATSLDIHHSHIVALSHRSRCVPLHQDPPLGR